MLNYMKSEIYRNLHSKGNYKFIGGVMGFCVFLNVVLRLFAKNDINFPYATTKFAFSSLYSSLGIPLMLCVAIVSLSFGQEYKNGTLKNSISFGISRSSIYFSKYIMSIILSFISLVCITGIYILSAYGILENSGVEYLNILIHSLIASAPLFLVSLTVAHCLYFIMDNEMSVVGAFAMIIVIIPQLLGMAASRSEICEKIVSYSPIVMVDDVIIKEIALDKISNKLFFAWSMQEGILRYIIVGIVGCVAVYFLGLLLFKKKEIK